MGIRFSCPNGHKLNVKSFLAGKRGICPHCQARFEIPAASTESGTAAAVSTTPTVNSGVDAEAACPAPDIATMPVILDEVAQPLKSTSPPPPEKNVVQDPIAEAPHAVWYVRPPSGGQFGPASADIMRTWLSEGRVPHKAMVWREGWPQWRTASELFPGLGESPTSNPPDA
ncbi:MAG: DUF4339 domain-containing protein, partial [Planctomycetales bacterium]|nr:DUF4339 domain-containing protein [Planctomycetales bacterium]